MAGYRDTTKATRPMMRGDWTEREGAAGRSFTIRQPRLECELRLTPDVLYYQESFTGGGKGVEITRADVATATVELMPGLELVRFTRQGQDLGLRAPHPLGLMILAWWSQQPPYQPR